MCDAVKIVCFFQFALGFTCSLEMSRNKQPSRCGTEANQIKIKSNKKVHKTSSSIINYDLLGPAPSYKVSPIWVRLQRLDITWLNKSSRIRIAHDTIALILQAKLHFRLDWGWAEGSWAQTDQLWARQLPVACKGPAETA